jgi:anti-sigma B factor antagonist
MSTDFSSKQSMVNPTVGLVEVSGEVDIYTALKFKEDMLAAIDAGATSLVIDLSDVTFMDSTALGVLIGGVKRMHAVDGRIVLVVCTRPVSKVLTITGLDNIFEIHDTREKALAVL